MYVKLWLFLLRHVNGINPISAFFDFTNVNCRNFNLPKENNITEYFYSQNLKKRILILPKFQIPENSKLMNFKIPKK